MSALRRRSAPSMRSRISGSAERGKDDEDMDRSRLAKQCNGGSLAALLRPRHFHREPLPLVQSTQSGTFDYGDVYEHVLSSVRAEHKAKPLFRIEPLHRAFDLDSGHRIGALAAVGRRAR